MLTDIKNLSLLLVDDSEDDAFFFARTLQKSGAICSLHHSENGTQALQFLQKTARSHEDLPRVVFLDLKLPVLNGFEVLEWIRGQAFPPEMQIVVLSGSERQDDKDRAAQLGATDYLVKPIKVSDLQRLLPGSCWADQNTGASFE
jgi:CheY-like chemotaxis protein